MTDHPSLSELDGVPGFASRHIGPDDGDVERMLAALGFGSLDDLTRVTLMSDGASVYECTSDHEVIDLLSGGQGVFGIAIGGVWREIEGSLAELPSERTVDDASDAPSAADELAARRAARKIG